MTGHSEVVPDSPAAPILRGGEGDRSSPTGPGVVQRTPRQYRPLLASAINRHNPVRVCAYPTKNQEELVLDFESPRETSTCLALLLLSLFCLLFPRGGSGLGGLQCGFAALLRRQGLRTRQAAFSANFNHRLSEDLSIHVQILHRTVHGGKIDLVLCLTP